MPSSCLSHTAPTARSGMEEKGQSHHAPGMEVLHDTDLLAQYGTAVDVHNFGFGYTIGWELAFSGAPLHKRKETAWTGGWDLGSRPTHVL